MALLASAAEQPLEIQPIDSNPRYASASLRMTEYPTDDETAWGEWTEFDTGLLSCESSIVTCYSSPQSITVMRRELISDGTVHQYKFCDVFAPDLNGPYSAWGVYGTGSDFIITEGAEGMYIDEQPLGWSTTVYPSGFDDGVWHIANRLPQDTYFTVDEPMTFNIFFLVDSTRGLEARTYYKSDKCPDYSAKVEVTGETIKGCYVVSDGVHVTFTPTEMAPTAKYVLSRLSGYVFNEDGTYQDGLTMLSDNDARCVSLIPGDNYIPLSDGSGNYTLSWAAYDPEGNCLNTMAMTRWFSVRASHSVVNTADDPSVEWVDLGQGMFWPTTFFSYADHLSPEWAYTPDIAHMSYPVAVQQRKDNPDIIRIVDPFGEGTPFEEINSVTRYFKYDEVIQGTNEDFVTFYHTDKGYIEIHLDKSYVANRYLNIAWYNMLYNFTCINEELETLAGWYVDFSPQLKEGTIRYDIDDPVWNEPQFILQLPNSKGTYLEVSDASVDGSEATLTFDRSLDLQAVAVRAYGSATEINPEDLSLFDTLNVDTWFDDGQTIYTAADGTVSFAIDSMNSSLPYWYLACAATNCYGQVVAKQIVTLPLAGVVGVNSDQKSISPIYYNLQGIRVDDPIPGQLYIRREGGSASKVLVK